MRIHRPSPSDPAAEAMQSALEWEAPRLPSLRDVSRMRRWTGPTWTAPAQTILVRHRSLNGPEWMLSLNRRPPDGFVLEYDLGQVHMAAQPGTSLLLGSDDGFMVTRFEGKPAAGVERLGYLEDAPLPLLDAVHLARIRDTGQMICVCGEEDPLLPHVDIVGTLGFIDGYPIQPRRALDDRGDDWGFVFLVRRMLLESRRHTYLTEAASGPSDVILGPLWTSSGRGLVELRCDSTGRVTSSLLQRRTAPASRRAVARWALAPLSWTDGRPEAWAARAAVARVRAGIESGTTGPAAVEASLGRLPADPFPGSVPLFSATHPALGDQFLTRSELEARDLGYLVDGILGHIGAVGAATTLAVMPKEIPWGSRFGQRRRYIEGAVSGAL